MQAYICKTGCKYEYSLNKKRIIIKNPIRHNKTFKDEDTLKNIHKNNNGNKKLMNK